VGRAPILSFLPPTYPPRHVYLARDRRTGDLVALKKVRAEVERGGFPITAIREIRVLRSLAHRNVIRLREVARSRPARSNHGKGSVYMAFDYCDSDLAGVVADAGQAGRPLALAHVKGVLCQLLRGVAYLHSRRPPVLHRDLKLSNLLVDASGVLKIADLGLARPAAGEDGGRMTNRVITLWYRPPELLLGSERYGPEIDVWSAGCILAELLTGRPLFQGAEEADQLGRITRLFGCPTEATWPGLERLPHAHFLETRHAAPAGGVAAALGRHLSELRAARAATAAPDLRRGPPEPLEPSAADLLVRMLDLCPARRASAVECLSHPFFTAGVEPDHRLPWKKGAHELSTAERRRADRRDQSAADARSRGR